MTCVGHVPVLQDNISGYPKTQSSQELNEERGYFIPPGRNVVRPIVSIFSRKSRREGVAEHRQAAFRLSLRGFVLEHIPMFGEKSVFDPDYDGCNPRRGHPLPEKRLWTMT
jgi:hypothetical protein